MTLVLRAGSPIALSYLKHSGFGFASEASGRIHAEYATRNSAGVIT